MTRAALSPIERLAWVADGVSASESSGVSALHELALDAPAVFVAVGERGWLQDGLTAAETRVLWTLPAMAGRSYAAADEAATLRILAMPFLDEVSGARPGALGLAAAVRPYPGASPARRCDPRSRAHARRHAARAAAAHGNGGALRPLRRGAAGGTLGILEELVRAYEAFMGAAFPMSHIAVVVADAAGGRGLFLDLYEALGDEAFRGGFLRLYLAMRDEAHEAQCAGMARGVCYVRLAFVGIDPPGSAALAAPVIDRWFGSPGE